MIHSIIKILTKIKVNVAEVAIPWICVTDKLKWSWKIHMDLKMPRLGNRYRVLR